MRHPWKPPPTPPAVLCGWIAPVRPTLSRSATTCALGSRIGPVTPAGRPRRHPTATGAALVQAPRRPHSGRHRPPGGGRAGRRLVVVRSGIETTSDAYLQAHVVYVAPQIAGQVTRVLVDENQPVHAGQPLVEIDPAQYSLALQQAWRRSSRPRQPWGRQRPAWQSPAPARRKPTPTWPGPAPPPCAPAGPRALSIPAQGQSAGRRPQHDR